MSSEEQVFIQVKALKKYFRIQPRIFLRPVGNLKVVENVTYDFLKGETLGLVCKSGCGKTIVGEVALQVLRVTTGRVQLDDIELIQFEPTSLHPLRRRMQMIFQDP